MCTGGGGRKLPRHDLGKELKRGCNRDKKITFTDSFVPGIPPGFHEHTNFRLSILDFITLQGKDSEGVGNDVVLLRHTCCYSNNIDDISVRQWREISQYNLLLNKC